MAITNYPNGVSSFGIPLIGSGPSIPASTGQYLFVSSITGSDGNIGSSVAPFATIAGAVNAVNTSKNDVVVLMPGHVEAVNKAAYLTIAKNGVYIIGLGQGALRPTLTWGTSTAAQIIVSGAQVTIDNVVLDFTGIDAVVAAVSVTGADFAIRNSTILTNSGTAGVVKGFLTAATATRFTVENNLFFGPAVNTGTTTTAQVDHEVGVDYVIRNNVFYGKCTQNILNATTVLGGVIDNNRFVTTGTVVITMATASTPFITNNRIHVASGSTPIVAAAGFVAGNIYSAAAGVTAGTAATI